MKFELTKEFIIDIAEKLNRQEFDLIKQELSEIHNADIAELIDVLDEENGKILFELFEDEESADILVELDDCPLLIRIDIELRTTSQSSPLIITAPSSNPSGLSFTSLMLIAAKSSIDDSSVIVPLSLKTTSALT